MIPKFAQILKISLKTSPCPSFPCFNGKWQGNPPKETRLAIGPAPQGVSRALRARNPGRVRKESGKSTPGQGPKSAQRVRPGVSKESEKSLKPDFWTLFGLFLDSFETAETPAEPSERPAQSPLRGKFPRRASRRVVPLGW